MSIPTRTTEEQNKWITPKNILAFGQLYYQRNSTIALNKMRKVQIESNQLAKISNQHLQNINQNTQDIKYELKDLNETTTELRDLAKDQLAITTYYAALKETELELDKKKYDEAEARRIIKENEKKENSYKRDAFHHLEEDLIELENSKISNLEKYISVKTLESILQEYKIDTTLTDDLVEKKMISNFIKKMKNLHEICTTKLSAQDQIDYNEIVSIINQNLKTDNEKIKKQIRPKITELRNKVTYLSSLKDKIYKLNQTNSLYEIVKSFHSIIKNFKK